jgi:hypothetical protein
MVSKKQIRFYFSLQYRMLNRQLTDFGLHPLAGYLLLVLSFTGLSFYLFLKTEFAVYVYFFLAIGFIYVLSESGRNSFLKSCFKTIDYYTIRIIENSLLALPFAAFLLFKSEFLPTLVLMIASGVLVIFNFRNTFNFTIPTPFSKKPFEFIVGFRNAFYAFILAYFLAFMAVTAVNFNLGIFALLVQLFICFTFYTNPESEFYVWIFSTSPAGFLAHKIKVALLYSTLLCLPVVAVLCIFFPENIAAILGFQSLGYLYLVTVILAKYAAFPNKMNLPQALVIAFSISFPPLLIGVIPYFFIQSVKSLKEILE